MANKNNNEEDYYETPLRRQDNGSSHQFKKSIPGAKGSVLFF
jgi:hypothetical protein